MPSLVLNPWPATFSLKVWRVNKDRSHNMREVYRELGKSPCLPTHHALGDTGLSKDGHSIHMHRLQLAVSTSSH